jgi:hypothetical protein
MGAMHRVSGAARLLVAARPSEFPALAYADLAMHNECVQLMNGKYASMFNRV